ncbi:uncharacterized protein METZ01_LOCUS282921, partial [marine metagenome]
GTFRDGRASPPASSAKAWPNSRL